ncbi:imelysin family protein [Halioxenophilus aromaticivorans]|uniref:Imelysin family protein n=1 Tax=Halioxenophilus aromaticivorans TaxID=1306992 RepID=A0AAV3TYP3_9ALTE
MRFLVIAISAVLLHGCQKTDPSQIFLQTYATQVATPYYWQLVSAADQLHSTTEQCDSNNPTDFITASQSQWQNTMSAWQKAKTVRFGPVVDERIDWEFQFWPDKKNLVAKKMQPFLKQAEPITDEQMSKSSVVLHGLSAMEYLLFDPSIVDSANPERLCESVQWIGQAIAKNAKTLDSAWALLQPDFTAPSETSDQFTSIEIAVAKVLDSYLVTLEEFANRKIGDAIGTEQAPRANPYFLESWRSQHSWQNIAANISAVNELFTQGGFSQYLTELGFTELEQQLQSALDVMNTAADAITPPLFSTLEQQTEALRQVQQSANDLRYILQNDITEVLNLPVGFNDQDGD